MKFSLELDIAPLKRPFTYEDKILLIGSCFTEHMSDRLLQHKFHVLNNPNGILFNPQSVAQSIDNYIDAKQYRKEDLFQLNELWNSWDHHTRFSDIDANEALNKINKSQDEAAAFIQEADWVIITLGSAFQYFLKENGQSVANNHRAPGQWFEKRLLTVDIIVTSLGQTIEKLKNKNNKINILFTISPVRHIRDGVVDNNRSKARLIEAVHQLCEIYSFTHYFPAYELIIDVLRDYRFYDIDFVHPNYMATSFVWERFTQSCISSDTATLMKEINEITIAKSHRPRFPQTAAHQDFRKKYAVKIQALLAEYPFLNLREELDYFSS